MKNVSSISVYKFHKLAFFFLQNIVTCSFIKLLTTKMMNQQLVLLSMTHIQWRNPEWTDSYMDRNI